MWFRVNNGGRKQPGVPIVIGKAAVLSNFDEVNEDEAKLFGNENSRGLETNVTLAKTRSLNFRSLANVLSENVLSIKTLSSFIFQQLRKNVTFSPVYEVSSLIIRLAVLIFQPNSTRNAQNREITTN